MQFFKKSSNFCCDRKSTYTCCMIWDMQFGRTRRHKRELEGGRSCCPGLPKHLNLPMFCNLEWTSYQWEQDRIGGSHRSYDHMAKLNQANFETLGSLKRVFNTSSELWKKNTKNKLCLLWITCKPTLKTIEHRWNSIQSLEKESVRNGI